MENRKFLPKFRKKEKLEVRLVSQKRIDTVFWLFLMGIIGVSVLTIVIAFTRVTRKNDNTQIQQVVQKTYDVDYRLQEFLEDYVAAYFNYASDYDTQLKQVEKLNSFYNFVPEVSSQGQIKEKSDLVSSELQEISDGVAVYKVVYDVGTDTKRVVVDFSIPYGEKDGKFYVSGLPWFEPVSDMKASDFSSKDQLKLTASDNLSTEERQEYLDFVKLFFTNYTTSQDNLNVISKDIQAISGAVFKSVDYSYFKKNGKNVIAYVQVTIEIAGSTHSENYTFELEPKDNSFYVKKLEHQIPVNYAE